MLPVGISRRRPSTGQGLVEFALVITIFMFMIMILFDGGRILYAQHTISQAAREGVRAGEVAQAWSQAKYDQIRQRVVAAAPGVGLSAADVTGAPGVCPVPDVTSPGTCFYPGSVLTGLVAGSSDAKVAVYVTTTVNVITPLIAAVLGNSVTLTTYSEGYIQCSGCESLPAATP